MRLFVAVWPSAEVVSRLAALDRPARPGLRWTTAEQWHVTLRFLGEVAEEKVQGVKAALEPLASVGRNGPVTAVAGPGRERLGPTALCLPVAGLDDLAATVAALTSGLGGPVGSFLGHLTLARAGPGVDLPPAAEAFDASWVVDAVTLVASTRHPDGARYQVIGRYPLDR